MDLDELSLEAADLIMYYPWNVDAYCDCIRKLSKYICIRISSELDDDYIPDEEESSDSDESEWDY